MRAPQYNHNKGKRRGGNPMSKPMVGPEVSVDVPNGPITVYIPGPPKAPFGAGWQLVPNRTARAAANAAARVIAGKHNPPRDKRLSLNDSRSYSWAPGHLHAQPKTRWQVRQRAPRRARPVQT